MSKRIALVGHCGPDTSFLRMSVGRAKTGAQVVSVGDSAELSRALEEGVDLLLLNRVLDYGFDETQGVELIPKIRAKYPQVKIMLVSNYPEAQAEAIAAGALPGFGKRDLGSPVVAERIRQALTGEQVSP